MIVVQIQRKKIFQRTFMSRMSPRSPTGLMGINQPNLGHKIQFGGEIIFLSQWTESNSLCDCTKEIGKLDVFHSYSTPSRPFVAYIPFHHLFIQEQTYSVCLIWLEVEKWNKKGIVLGKSYHPTNNRIANDRKCDSGEKYFCWNQ